MTCDLALCVNRKERFRGFVVWRFMRLRKNGQGGKDEEVRLVNPVLPPHGKKKKSNMKSSK